ncbi:hypothetical protein PIB30_089517, partial [Stylosanthes scabra]|nr:hypothetical protein [Stylosanthes scabra]
GVTAAAELQTAPSVPCLCLESFPWSSSEYTSVLVDWEGASRDETTWEDFEELQLLFPEVDLEDKVVLEEGIADSVGLSPLRTGLENQNETEELEESTAASGPIPESQDEPKIARIRKPPTWMKDYVSK